MSTQTSTVDAHVTGVNGNLVAIEVCRGAVAKNEVAYICRGREKLQAEVLRVQGRRAYLQVYEDTRGVRIGNAVQLSGGMLSVTLGPGLLGSIYDGLQKPLPVLAEQDGFFLKRGRYVDALDSRRQWTFEATRRAGERVVAGDPLGQVQERRLMHKIMVPFGEPGEFEIVAIQSGNYTLGEPVVCLQDASGRQRSLGLVQTWPVRRPLPQALLRQRRVERLYPSEPLITTIRLIDSFFPIALGGSACIPGPFGAGKTVLQSLLARYSTADVVIVVACGERAGEVVETIDEFSQLSDPRGGGSLMDRSIVVCNTSSMPVAAREASLFTGITLGEYYRQMGHNVLLLADSTSRWAQAMRETSGRMEEIPGEEAFPAYLNSAIKGVYERAGVLRTGDGSIGSLTMIGTVSPAGGNFEEPVTQSTLGTVKAFLGLSYERAYKRFYPAIDPLLSWSRYPDQLRAYFEKHVQPGWTSTVQSLQRLLQDGERVRQMMQVTGEEGVTLEDFVRYLKATFVDMVYLQQDAFDPVDISMPLERQVESLTLVNQIVKRDYLFDDRDQAREYFTLMTGLFKNLHYSQPDTHAYKQFKQQILSARSERTSADAGSEVLAEEEEGRQ